MPDLDWAKIKAATLMIGACTKSFDWRTASPDAIGCEVGDITGKLAMCLNDQYFEAFGGPAGWIESVTAEMPEEARAIVRTDGRGEGIPGRRAGARRDRCVYSGRAGTGASRDRNLSGVAVESAERQSLEIRRQVARASYETAATSRLVETG